MEEESAVVTSQPSSHDRGPTSGYELLSFFLHCLRKAAHPTHQGREASEEQRIRPVVGCGQIEQYNIAPSNVHVDLILVSK